MSDETVAKLKEALMDADCRCQQADEEIRALCIAISDRIEKGDTRVKTLLDMISDRAVLTMDAINSRAEEFGCNYRGTPVQGRADQCL